MRPARLVLSRGYNRSSAVAVMAMVLDDEMVLRDMMCSLNSLVDLIGFLIEAPVCAPC